MCERERERGRERERERERSGGHRPMCFFIIIIFFFALKLQETPSGIHLSCLSSVRRVFRTYLLWEVLFKFSDRSAPVSSALLADQLDVQKRPLSRPVNVTRSCPSDDTGRHIGHNVLQIRIGGTNEVNICVMLYYDMVYMI